MNSRTQSFIKYIASILFTVAIVAGGIYAASITNLTQTANSGDTITSQWVNAVNTASVGAAGTYSITCSIGSVGDNNQFRFIHTCVRLNNITGVTECKERDRLYTSTRWNSWASCDNGAPTGCMDWDGSYIACPASASNPW